MANDILEICESHFEKDVGRSASMCIDTVTQTTRYFFWSKLPSARTTES